MQKLCIADIIESLPVATNMKGVAHVKISEIKEIVALVETLSVEEKRSLRDFLIYWQDTADNSAPLASGQQGEKQTNE